MELLMRLRGLLKGWTRLAFIVIALLVAGFVAYLLVRSMNSPAVGTVKEVDLPKERSSVPEEPGTSFYEGTHISFDYPPGFRHSKAKLTGSYVEIVHLYSASKSITIGVASDPNSYVSAINVRRQRPDTYQEERSSQGAIVFTSRKSGYERVAFLRHGQLSASVSVLSASGEDMQDVSEQVLEGFRWK